MGLPCSAIYQTSINFTHPYIILSVSLDKSNHEMIEQQFCHIIISRLFGMPCRAYTHTHTRNMCMRTRILWNWRNNSTKSVENYFLTLSIYQLRIVLHLSSWRTSSKISNNKQHVKLRRFFFSFTFLFCNSFWMPDKSKGQNNIQKLCGYLW